MPEVRDWKRPEVLFGDERVRQTDGPQLFRDIFLTLQAGEDPLRCSSLIPFSTLLCTKHRRLRGFENDSAPGIADKETLWLCAHSATARAIVTKSAMASTWSPGQ